jgi:hypothetical protein
MWEGGERRQGGGRRNEEEGDDEEAGELKGEIPEGALDRSRTK